MVIKEGYKQTEIGVIPKDWEIVQFNDIADKNKKWSITGGPFGSNLKTSDYTNDGIQIIQLQNIGDGRFFNQSQVFTSEEKANELLSCNIYPNDLILSKMGDPVARCCFIPDGNKRYLMASDGIKLVVNEKEFSKKFIHDYINSKYFRLRAFEISTGSTRLRIGLPDLKSLLVIKPSLQEQTAIATALSDADELITGLEKLIAKKRNIKQGAMQQLLQPNPEVSGGWEVKKLGEVAEMYSGGTPLTSIPSYYNGNIPWVVIADITKAGKYISETEKTISQEGVSNSSAKLFKKGVLLFAMYASIGKTTIALMDTTCNQAILGIEPKSIDKEYLYYFLSFNERHFITMGQTGTQSNLSKDMVQKLEIPFPKSKEEQTKIAAILSDMDAELSALEEKLEKYKKIKLGMMQELLTGKIRLV
jgi:type I restriction enzyme S subunit